MTIDTEPPDVAMVEELESQSDLGSKREICLTGIRLLHSLYLARRRGLSPQLVDPKTQEVTQFDWRNFPKIEPIATPRRLFAARVPEATVRSLRARAAELQDPDLTRVSATITQAVWDPSGRGEIDTSVLAELIVITVGLRHPPLLTVTRDLLTQLCAAFNSFDHLLNQAAHGYQPSFETHHIEQRFLSDEYRREVPLRAKNALP